MPSPLIHHVGLSVRDIEKSAGWYAELFDLTLAAEFDEPAPMKVFMTPRGQAIDLRQDPALEQGEFSQTRVGLDVVPREVVDGDAADRGLSAERGVGPVMVVGV